MNIPEIPKCLFCDAPGELLPDWGEHDRKVKHPDDHRQPSERCPLSGMIIELHWWNRRQPTPEAAPVAWRVGERFYILYEQAIADAYCARQPPYPLYAHPPKPEPTEPGEAVKLNVTTGVMLSVEDYNKLRVTCENLRELMRQFAQLADFIKWSEENEPADDSGWTAGHVLQYQCARDLEPYVDLDIKEQERFLTSRAKIIDDFRARKDLHKHAPAIEAPKPLAEWMEAAAKEIFDLATSVSRSQEEFTAPMAKSIIAKHYSAPAGYQMVPVEPTDEQLLLMFRAFHTDKPEVLESVLDMSDLSDVQTRHLRAGYVAALAAAPKDGK